MNEKLRKEVPAELVAKLTKAGYFERRDIYGEGGDRQYRDVPHCKKCGKLIGGTFDFFALLHIWGSHEIKPAALQAEVRAALVKENLVLVNGEIITEGKHG